MQYVIFHATIYSIVAIMHLYFWWRLVQNTDLPRPWRALVTSAILVLAPLMVAPFYANHYFASPWREIVMWAGYLWMGLAFFLFVGLLATDVLRLLLWFWVPLNPRVLALGVCLLTAGVGIFASIQAARGPVVNKIRVTLPGLPKSLSGTRIAQLSDIHIGGLLGRKYAEKIVRMTNELKPDIVAITGDLVDGTADAHANAVDVLKDLNSKYGVFFTTGNHEYYSGVEPWLEHLATLNLRILHNERVTIGTEEEGFTLAGIPDPTARSMKPDRKPDLARTLEGRNPKLPVVLMAHQPKQVFEAEENGVSLQLSGHTHGGQIWPFGYLTLLAQPYLAGLHEHGKTQIYVNVGTGYWGPPMRLGTRGEITLIELASSET